jgi:tRNA threonylcarbamoyl adenosine modification protein (Sua5/YciO/YrdC/YwlC family)
VAQYLSIHATHPQGRLIKRAAEILRTGGVIAYPTDSCYALGCHLGDARAVDRLRRVKGIAEKHHLTLMCRNLSEIASYAVVDDATFALLKIATPGSYTFILRARREIPRRLLHVRRRTIGVRISGHPVAHALLEELDEPILSATLMLPGDVAPLSDGQEIRERLDHQLDLVIDAGSCGVEPSTVLDLTGEQPLLVREGRGSLAPFSVERV